MPDPDLEKLIGGYATGTLTEEERRVLFQAALHDQNLFNALADEQALKDLLDDPASRRRLLASLATKPEVQSRPWLTPILAWIRRPANLGMAGGLATAAIAVVLFTNLDREHGFLAQDEVFTEATPSQRKAESEPTRITSEDDTLRQTRLDSKADITRLKDVEEKPAARAPRARTDKPTVPGPTISHEPLRVGKPPAVTKTKKKHSKPLGGLMEAEEAIPAIEPKQRLARRQESALPKAGLQKAQASSIKATESGKKPVERRRLPASLVSPKTKQGPARELFYSQAGRFSFEEQQAETDQSLQPLGGESRALMEERKDDAGSGSAGFGGPARSRSLKESPPKPLGLRYSILKREADGRYTESDSSGPFSRNDALRLTVEVNEPGYLYVVQQRHDGEWTMLFPRTEIGKENQASARVVSRKRYVFPLTGSLAADTLATPNKLLMVFSSDPLPEVQKPASAGNLETDQAGRGKTGFEASFADIRAQSNTHPLLQEKIDPSNPKAPKEHAIYVINPAPELGLPIFVEMHLSTGP